VFTSPGRWPLQLLAIGALGALLTLIVAGSAVLTLQRTIETGHLLSALSAAQRLHQDADMMHDALRADVLAAQQAALTPSPSDDAQALRLAKGHADQLRRDLAGLGRVQVPSAAAAAVAALRGPREQYATVALQLVRSELRREAGAEERNRFAKLFRPLVLQQAAVTTTLSAAAKDVERTQNEQEQGVAGVLVAASGVALVGWASLVGMLRRSGMRLYEALDREAEQRAVADQLQRSLLPERLPQISGVRVAARSQPVSSRRRVGGDWYDVIALPSGEVGLVVGDVVGHDLRAATAMGQLRAALRAFAVYEPSPAAVLTQVNTVADLLQVTDLTTCVYAIANPTTRVVRWASAGHLNPLAMRASGQGHLLKGDPGPPIGVSNPAVYVDRTWRLEPQGSLMLYTDGLVERRSTSLTDNLTRLEHIQGPHAGPEELCDHVLEVLLSDEPSAGDDVTVLALQAA
jgi:serine phosphatase RsbU (regulator of sigma subunit)